MGGAFDRKTAQEYEAWAQGPQGLAMDRWLKTCLPSLLAAHPGERVLDIGCGSGTHLLFLKELGLDISGVDPSPLMINQARKRLGSWCTLKTGAAEDLPFEDNTFDLSVMIRTLEFLENPVAALREAGRVTRRAVFVGGTNSASWSGLCRRMQGVWGSASPGVCRYYNLWTLRGIVRSALGPVPMAWHSSQEIPPLVGRVCGAVSGIRPERPLPFGAFVGLAATILYRVKTDNLAVKAPVRRAGRSVPSGATLGHIRAEGGVQRHERSDSV